MDVDITTALRDGHSIDAQLSLARRALDLLFHLNGDVVDGSRQTVLLISVRIPLLLAPISEYRM